MDDKELKAKWVEALRSGRYTQGQMALRRAGTHCCLGVLAEIMGMTISDWVETSYHNDEETNDEVYSKLKKVVGSYNYPTFGNSPATSKLVDMNDSFNKSFNEIADWIEENL